MARTKPISPFFFIFVAIFNFSTVAVARDGESQSFSRVLSLGAKRLKHEKVSHLHFYFHDILSGHNPTAIKVAEAPSTEKSPTEFGIVMMIDDLLTERPEATSKVVGKAQGFYASASQSELGLLMTLNFVFMEGKYNGSTLSMLGRNPIMEEVREMPVVGGSGLFRFARGYAHAKTHWLDPTTGDAVVEYNVYVIHY